ncbi:hypothetical protein ACTQ5K_13915 [Niallia sp. Sow4_A1]|uniref:hypothetical protein n=1 Tax=Bacillaceae TaxID=186817 RepID=UPI0004E27788|nr:MULTISPECIES: hypothetical protein [unclassified Bacillus (in: firmicutes)]CAI9391138.1 hypothetical protein BACSP_02904 [Bacillus sp. T2.9-1]
MRTILYNSAFAIVAVYIIIHIDNYLVGIIPLISLWVMYDYTHNLEKKTDVNRKVKTIGTICYLVIAIIGLFLFLL